MNKTAMKTKVLLVTLIALSLIACKKEAPAPNTTDEEPEEVVSTAANTIQETVYSTKDALAFGLKGKVQAVYTNLYSAYENDDELLEGSTVKSTHISFDERGNIVHDEWNNEYGYDADGNFYRGNHTYTKVNRDKAGRITKYTDKGGTGDDDHNLTISLSYDKNGRINNIVYNSNDISWSEQRQYEKANLYPLKSTIKAKYLEEDGSEATTTTTYRYGSFDSNGNWTERLCLETQSYDVQETIETEEGTDSIATVTKLNEQIFIEKRSIEYFE